MRSYFLFLLLLFLSIVSLASKKTEIQKDSLLNSQDITKAKAFLTIANLYYPNNNDSTLFYAEKSLLEYQILNDEKGMSSCYGLIAAIYSGYGMYDTAIALTYKVIDWGEKNEDLRAFIAYLHIANIYETIGQYDNAKEFYAKAMNGSYLPSKMAATANMGLLYLDNKQWDSAAFYFTKSLAEYYKSDTSLDINKYNIASIYLNLATIDFGTKNYEKGIKLLRESNELFKEIGNYSSMANVYLKFGEGYELINKETIAFNYFKKAEQIADSMKLQPLKEQVYHKLFEYYKKRNKSEEALFYHIKYDSVRDSLIIESHKTTIAELEFRYKLKDKINKIESLKKEKKQFLSTVIVAGLSLLAIALVIILILNNKRLRHRNEKITSDAKSHLSQIKAEQAKRKLERIKSNLHEKSSLIEELKSEISKLKNKDDKKQMEDKVQILRETRILTNDDWEEYIKLFIKIYPTFFTRTPDYDNLSAGDKRQMIFLKLGLSRKEIAYLMGISQEGVKRARQRLSRKIGLNSSSELITYIKQG